MRTTLNDENRLQLSEIAWELHKRFQIPVTESYRLYKKSLNHVSYNGPKPAFTTAPKWFIKELNRRKNLEAKPINEKDIYNELKQEINELRIEVANLKASILINKPQQTNGENHMVRVPTPTKNKNLRVAVCELLPNQFNILENRIPTGVDIVRVKKDQGIKHAPNVDYVLIPKHASHDIHTQSKNIYGTDRVIRFNNTSVNQIAKKIESLLKKHLDSRLTE